MSATRLQRQRQAGSFQHDPSPLAVLLATLCLILAACVPATANSAEIFPSTVTARLFKPHDSFTRVEFMILADSDNSDDVKWSVYEPGESHGLYTNASFSALSGALAPGGREVVYIDVNVTGKEAKDREEIFIRIAIDDDPFHLELSLNLLVSSEPDVENCKLYVTNNNPDEGVGKAYAYAGEHTQLGVRAFDVDGFASTVSDVFFQCFLRDLSPSSDGSTDGTDGNFYHPKYSGDNTFVHDANPYMAGFWELNCKLDDADVRHAVNLTVLPGSPRTTDTRGEDLLSRKRANDTFAICYPDMACGEAMTAGGSPVLMRVELRDIYDNSVKALDGWEDLYFKTWGHLLAKNDDIISSDFHFELTDNRKGHAEANLSFTIAGNYRLEVFTGGTLIDETTLIVNAAEMTSVELFLIKFETEEYNATEILLLINRGPEEFGDALACAWKGCLEAKAGETIVGFVYGHDDYDNIVLPQRQGQVAHYRFVQGEDSAPFADFDGADAAYSLSGALLSVHPVESPTLLSTEIISTFVFVYNVMTLPPYDGDIYVRPLLYVGDRVDATASEAFQASTKEIGDFALIPGDLNFTQSVLFIFYPDTRQIISCARDSDTACADVRMGTDFVVGLSGKDNYGNKLVEMGDERVQLRLDDPITGSEEWTINADFQDDFEIFGSLVDDGMIIEYCQGTGRCTTGGTATTLQLRLIDERRRDADYASRASWEGNLTVNIIAGEASAADTRLYPADSSAAVAGSECKNGMSCGEDIAADKMTYFLAELVDEWGNPLNSNENGLLVSATVVIDGQEETAPITDRGDGTFLFAGTIKIAGQHDVRVFVDNEEPETSPFKVQIVAGSLQPSASVVRAFRHDSGAEFAKECATRVSCITVAAGELVQFQVFAYDEYQNPSDSTGGCSFRVGGASTDELSVARFDADDGAYVFNASLTAVPAGAGLTYVDVWFGAVADSTNGTVGGGSFALTVTAAEASAERSYITLLWEVDSSVCPLASDRACVTVDAASDVNFQVHLVDAFRNELTRATSLPVTYSLGDDASRIEVPSVSGRYSIVVRGAALEVAGEYSIGVYLDGNALAAGPVRIDVVPGDADAGKTQLKRDDEVCPSRKQCGSDVVADESIHFTAVARDAFGNERDASSGVMELRVPDQAPTVLTDMGDGSYRGTLALRRANVYTIDAVLNSEPLFNSPFDLAIIAAPLQPSASVVRAFRHDSGAEFAKECATRVSCITVAAGELVQFQVFAYDEYQNRRYQNPSDSTGGCSFRVGGASTDELSVARFDADDGAYVFNASLTAVPAGAGLTYVDVWFGAVADSTNGTVGGGSFALTVTAAEASAERSYITLLWEVDSSVCPLASDRACVTVDAASDVNFQVHLVDAFRNELTRATSLPVTYSLGDDASRIEVPSVSGRYSIVVRGAALEVAGEYSIGVYLDGNALAAGPVRIDVVPGDADAGKTQLKRDDEVCPSRKQCGSDVVADESIHFTAVARDAFGNERDASSGVMELRVPDQAPTVLTDMGDGSYRGTLALRRANVYTIDAVLNSEPLLNSPFDLAIIAAPLAALNSSVRILVEDGEFPDCADAAALTLGACVTSAAGKWLRLEVVPRDKFLNTAVIENGVTCSVTHTFDEAAGALGPPALDPEPSACEVSQGVLGFNARLRAAGELGFGVMLNGVAVGNAMVRVDVQPTALDLATTEVIRLGARDGDIECFSGRKSACGPLVPPGNAISLRVRLRDALGNQLSRTAVGDFDVSLGGGNVSETTFRVDVTDLSAGVFEVEAVSSLVGAYEVAVIVEGDIAATLVLEWQSKPVSAYGELTLSAPEDSDPNSKEARQALRKAIAESLGVSIEWIQIDAVFEAGAGPAAAEDTAASQRRHLARALQQVGGAYNVEYTITSPDRGDTEEVLAAAAKIEELVPEDITAALASVAPELSFEVATLASLGADEFEEPELSPADSPLHTGQEECEDDKSCPISSEVMLAGTAQNYTVTLVDEFQNIMGFAPKSVGCAIEVTDQLGEIAADAITSAFEPRVLARGVCIVNARPVRTGRYFMRVFLGSVDEANAVAAMQRGVKFVVEAAASSSVQVSKFAFDDGTVVSAGEPFTVTIHSRDEFGNLRAYNDDNFTVTATPQPGTALRPVGQASWAPLKAGSSHLGEGKHAAVIADTSQAAQYCVSVTLGNASIGFQGGAESNACFQVQPAALSPPNTTVVHVVDPSSALQETRPGLPYEIIGDAEYLLTVEARDRFGNIRATSEDTFKVRARDVSGEAITGLLYETNTVARVTAHRVSFFAVREQASRAQVNITAENIGDAKASVHISGSPFTAQVFCPAGYLPFSIAGEVPGCVECDEELVECHGGTGAPFSIPQGLYLPPVASRCVGGGCILSSVYECKQEAACTTDDENTTRLFENWATIDVEQASLCAEGYDPAVVLCDSCLPGWTLNDAGDGCEQCPPGDGETYLRFFGLVGVLLLLCFLVFVVLYRSLQKDGVSMRDAAGRGLAFLHENLEFLRDDLEDTAENVGAVWQIVLQNCQVLGQLWKQMSSRFPNFLEKLYAPLLVLDVNPFSVMKVGCLASGFSQGYWDNVLFKGSIPFMVAFVAGFVAYRKLRQIVHGAQTGMPKEEVEGIRTTMATALVFAIFFLNLLHPSISSTMFETFNCKSYDLYKSSGEAWLQSDSSVQCYTDQWLPYAIFSGAVIILYVFGYPLILFVGLRYLHKRQKVVPCDADGVPIPGAPAFYTRKLQPRKPEPQDASEAKPDLVSPNTREAVLAQAAAAGRREAAGSSGALAWPGPGPQPGGIKLVRILSAPMRSFLGGRRGEGEEVVKALVPPHTLPPLSMEREHDGAGDVDGDSDSDGSGASSEEEEEYEWWAPDPHNKLNRTVYSGAESFVKHVRSALEDEDAKAKAARRARRMSRKHDTLLTDGKGFIRVARVMRTIKGNFGSQIEVPVTQLNNDEVFKQFVHPFVVQYQEDYYYWQVYEIGRRLMQTSFVVLVEIASPDYVAMYALFVSILGLCIQLYYLPYAEDDDDTLEVAFQLNLFITLFGIVSQENIGHEWAGSWQEAVIMACSTLLGCYVIYRLYRIMREWAGIVLGASREMCGIMCRSCWSWCIPALGRKAPSETGSDSTPEAGRAAESADGSGKGAEADAVATS